MNFITGLFSDSGNSLLTMVFALGAVLVLIVLGVWLLKLISNVSGNAVRGRNRRLSVIDTLAIDQKRQLLVIRRDNVEHLILVGGPQDVVVETGIPVVEQPAPQSSRRPLPSIPVRPKSVTAADPETTAAKPATAIEQLRDLGQTGSQRNRRSLRNTGLLRPVSGQDDALGGNKSDKAPGKAADSAKEDRVDEPLESAAFEQEHGNEANRS